MDYKNGKWAKKILELQHDDGSWGNEFHSLSNPSSKPMTTEQALRRLEILGYTIDDKPIKKTIKYMTDCLIGNSRIPDREEKRHNMKIIYMPLMLSTWIRVFTNENEFANNIAEKWANIINAAFKNGHYDNGIYVNMYEKIMEIKLNPEAGRLVDFVHFYPVSLLTNILDRSIEPKYFEYILQHEGMFYIYDKRIKDVPTIFQAKTTSNYLRAIELLVKYDNPECKKQLKFVKIWLKENMFKNNEWDMGKEAKDDINFPLSDSWKTEEDRIKDCTYRISNLLNYL